MKIKRNEDLILEYLIKVSDSNEVRVRGGCCTEEIAKRLGMKRTNVSTILNSLHEAGKIIKVKGRPVLYAVNSDKITSVQPSYEQGGRTKFDMLVGGNKSLAKCIQRAKAAMLYPPHGLHTIILGPTGVGKTMFAEMMYNFALEKGIYSSNAPFISFNCADYANNPQLLLAQLFGCKKGAFTGADRDRPGIVDKANGGVLFLDEVHRLPPEGQEMLFYLIDKGLYSPLGDVDNKKSSEVLIICSTTEDIDNVLLTTFTRRIPMNVFIPALKDRTIDERLDLVCEFFKIESRRIGMEIVVSANALRALLLYHCKGNVGQLKSDIQFGCANAFLKFISKGKKSLQVESTDFANYVRQGMILYKKQAVEVDKLIHNNTRLCFKPNKVKTLVKGEDDLPKNFYEDIEKRIQELQERGIDEEEINFTMSFDIESYFKKYIRNFEVDVNKDELSRIVHHDIITVVEELLKNSGEKLRRAFSSKVFYGLCLHLQSSIERIKQKKPIINHNIKGIIDKYPNEYAVALHFTKTLEKKYNLHIPVDEVGFIAMFLAVDGTTDNAERNKPIVVVATHGKSMATSMVEVAEKLAGADNLYAYDMPLDKNPKTAYEEIKDLIVKNHQGAGVILLVDMGALTMFGELISEETGIEIQMLDMASTLLVIECARKSLIGTNVVEICADIKKNNLLFANYTHSIAYTLMPKKDNIIITLCTTGEGSAIKIKTLLEDKLALVGKNIQVLPMSINDRKQLAGKINNLSKEKKIIAVVGTFNPGLYNIPFVPVSAIFGDENLCGLKTMVDKIYIDELYNQVFFAMQDEMQEIDMEDYKRIFFELLSKLEEKLHKTFEAEVVVGLIMHLACAISRMRRDELAPVCLNKEHLKVIYSFEFECIKENIRDMEQFYNFSFGEDEIWFIFQILMSI
ncbi:MAG: hypothetical protein H6Q69_1254 [Firmicutes bacterium]|nr:hypothetical protein [Bacillota bacterium]